MAYGDTALLHARMLSWLSLLLGLRVERLESLTKTPSRRLRPKLAVQSLRLCLNLRRLHHRGKTLDPSGLSTIQLLNCYLVVVNYFC